MDRNLTLVVFIGHCREFVVHRKWTLNRVIEKELTFLLMENPHYLHLEKILFALSYEFVNYHVERFIGYHLLVAPYFDSSSEAPFLILKSFRENTSSHQGIFSTYPVFNSKAFESSSFLGVVLDFHVMTNAQAEGMSLRFFHCVTQC